MNQAFELAFEIAADEDRCVLPRYVIITAARNEREYIERTLASVVAQTVLPLRWLIVDDGSTDGTGEIVEQYVCAHHWIELIRTPPRQERTFSAKALGFNHALDRLSSLDHEVVVNLDADVSFGPGYFAFLLERIARNPSIGVCGSRYTEKGSSVAVYSHRDVAGQCQVFRRDCLEQIGGYRPSRYGGVDWMAVRMARMQGWQTRTFEGPTFEHHRVMSSAERNRWIARVRTGRKDYVLGNHPLWEGFRIVYQMSRRPYLVGGALLMFGYLWAATRRLERPLTPELLAFHRSEQLQRLRIILRNPFRLKQTMMET